MTVGRGRRLFCGGAIFLSSLVVSEGQAHVTRLTVILDYGAAAGCPAAADFKAVVIARLGYDPFAEDAPDHVLVRIDQRGGAMDGRIE